MDSVTINGAEPKLLQLTVWLEARYEKDAKVTIQVGTRAPLIHNNYIPTSKVYFYDIAQKNQLPVLLLAYNSLKIPLDLSEHQQGVVSSIRSEDLNVCFLYELMNQTSKLEQKYLNIKEPQDKMARGQGLTNFVRAESEFLALFQRDEEVEQIRAAELEEEKIEKDITDEIISLRRAKVESKIIIVIFVLFLVAGFLFKAIQNDPIMLDLKPARKISTEKSRKHPRRKGKRIN